MQHEVIENVKFAASNFRLNVSRKELGFKGKDEKDFKYPTLELKRFKVNLVCSKKYFYRSQSVL